MPHPLKDISLPYYAKYTKVETSEGININVLQAKDPTVTSDQPLMLFIHGFPESGLLSWHKQIPYFSNLGYNVIAPDLRGYNDSSKPSDPLRRKYAAQGAHVEDMAAILKHFLKNGTKATVVGHDFGGIIAWSVAGNFPDLVESLVILSAPKRSIKLSASELWQTLQPLRSWYAYYFQLPYLPERRVMSGDSEFFLSFTGLKELARQGHIGRPILDRYKQLFQTSISTMINIYRSSFAQSFIPNILSTIDPNKKSQAPTLVLVPKKDPFIHHLVLQKSFNHGIDEKVFGKSRIEYFENATHWINKEEPDRVNESILTFLKDSGATLSSVVRSKLTSEREELQKQKEKQEEKIKNEPKMTPEELIIARTEEAARIKLEQEEAKKHAEELRMLKEREEAAQIEAEHIKSKKIAEEKERQEQRRIDLENAVKQHEKLAAQSAQEQLATVEQDRQFEHAQSEMDKKILLEVADQDVRPVPTIDDDQFEKKILSESKNAETIVSHQIDAENERERKDFEVLNQVLTKNDDQ
ncbi:hypothetical protein AKO1_015542 [Acrasis kona]|uniref:AB hydrolase-1 domain-containing protein n=1 Tax=Acrasis kona TaxID=1008807 RepID=A0AAW2ZI63_9EUKA